jgi:hypothetical protein
VFLTRTVNFLLNEARSVAMGSLSGMGCVEVRHSP